MPDNSNDNQPMPTWYLYDISAKALISEGTKEDILAALGQIGSGSYCATPEKLDF